MADTGAPSTITTVRDTKTGRDVKVAGIGALRGQLTLMKGLDLTKPIASQVMKGNRRRPTPTPA